MTNVASREVRYVNFSWMYHAQMREIVLAVDAEQDPTAGHDYSARVAHVVLLAAFIVEATANEVAYWLATLVGQPRIQVPGDFDRKSVRDKWRALPLLCGAAAFDEAAEPWLDFDTLITLRNSLVHPRPYPEGHEKVLQRLDALGCTRAGVDWFESIMTPRTAKWATRVAAGMPERLRQLLEPHIDLQNGGFAWQWGSAWLPSLW